MRGRKEVPGSTSNKEVEVKEEDEDICAIPCTNPSLGD
jgi:hypothetical protein